MRYFPINSPTKGNEQRIYYNAKDDKKQLLQDHMLDYWSPYCDSRWLWFGKFELNKWNYEDKVKSFLNRCANFLLIGDYERSNVMSGNDIGRVLTNELSLDGNWQDNSLEIDLDETIDYLNKDIRFNFARDSKMLETNFDTKPTTLNKKAKSKTAKMINIYSEDEKEFDDYEKIHQSNTFYTWKQCVTKFPKRDGTIDKTKPYIAEWCIVDTENEFEFKENKCKIDEGVAQYSIRMKKPNYDDYKSDYQMDRILVYEQENDLYFYDQNINQMSSDDIIVK